MSRFGTSLFGSTEFLKRRSGGALVVACLGDAATHKGSITVSGQDGSVCAGGAVIAVQGAMFHCDDDDDDFPIIPIITKTFINGKLVITSGARATCGAVMLPPDRKVRCG